MTSFQMELGLCDTKLNTFQHRNWMLIFLEIKHNESNEHRASANWTHLSVSQYLCQEIFTVNKLIQRKCIHLWSSHGIYRSSIPNGHNIFWIDFVSKNSNSIQTSTNLELYARYFVYQFQRTILHENWETFIFRVDQCIWVFIHSVEIACYRNNKCI